MKLEYAHGSTRLVLFGRRNVYKLPSLRSYKHFLGGLLANMQEVEFATTDWPQLCPVSWSLPGGWLLAMPRAEPLTDEEWNELDFVAFTEHPDYRVPVENKRDSFGTLEGHIVAVDYGT